LSGIGKLWIPVLVILILTALIVQTPRAQASTVSPSLGDKALSFLRNVVQLDLSKYRVTLYENDGDQLFYKLYPIHSLLLPLRLPTWWELGTDVFFYFYNGKLESCTLSPSTEGLIYSHPVPDRFNATLGMAERFAAWANDPWVLSMVDLMEKVGSDKTAFEVSGNQSLRITLSSDGFGEYQFSNYLNGVEYTGVTISMGKPTSDVFFTDSRASETIGNTTIGVSREQAIRIAEDYVKNYSFNETFGNGTIVHVSNLNVTGVASAGLTSDLGENLTLFPFWDVSENVSNMPLPAIGGFEVELSANNGAIKSALQFANSNFQIPPSLLFISTDNSTEILIVATIAVVTLTIAVLLFLARREKKLSNNKAG
jgi:hypothetical protein